MILVKGPFIIINEEIMFHIDSVTYIEVSKHPKDPYIYIQLSTLDEIKRIKYPFLLSAQEDFDEITKHLSRICK